ncbi:putative regulatory protein, FmdB family [compost metagenome]|uniref:Putative regulatory protein, FmdB family n=1 Tax=Pseudomonas jinjuensis TaxID=198616 RepID=A0A1H0A6V8_9PSED|nr:FmdB family zinc ribbon protein [Pseudomonas jinjuensis]SDN28743.1 putative regulatory protein, FmdB family [Pseudomonas jinjuensis]
MPIYEYQCGSCNHQLEAIQKFSDAPLVDCPACSAPELKKLLSAPGFRLSGGGWYETDFKTGAKKNLASSDGPAACPATGCSGGACAAGD